MMILFIFTTVVWQVGPFHQEGWYIIQLLAGVPDFWGRDQYFVNCASLLANDHLHERAMEARYKACNVFIFVVQHESQNLYSSRVSYSTIMATRGPGALVWDPMVSDTHCLGLPPRSEGLNVTDILVCVQSYQPTPSVPSVLWRVQY